MENVVTEEVNNHENNNKSTAGDDSDSDDFFARPSTATCDSKSMLMDWLNRPPSEHLSVEEFTTFKALLPLFVATNTGVPSSASVERLFSSAGRIFQPKRATLTDNNFENQLLCYLNKKWQS